MCIKRFGYFCCVTACTRTECGAIRLVLGIVWRLTACLFSVNRIRCKMIFSSYWCKVFCVLFQFFFSLTKHSKWTFDEDIELVRQHFVCVNSESDLTEYNSLSRYYSLSLKVNSAKFNNNSNYRTTPVSSHVTIFTHNFIDWKVNNGLGVRLLFCGRLG